MTRRRWAVAAAVAIGGATTAAVVAGRIRSDTLPEQVYEDPHLADPATAGAALTRARARLTGAPVDRGTALEGDGARALWVCAYRPPADPRCAPGEGSDSASAIDAAMAKLGAADPDVRLKIDWVVARERARWPDDADLSSGGAFGIAVRDAVILPSEILERDLLTILKEDDPPTWDEAGIRALLAARGAPVGDTFRFDRLRTTSWVEGADGRPIRLYRVHAWDRVETGPPELERRARWAADALADSVGDDGRIAYRWDVYAGAEKKGSNLLRHAGSTFALLQAAERFDEPRYREAARRAIGFLLGKTVVDQRSGPYGGGRARYVREGSHIKLGGAALALLALATWQRTTGDESFSVEAGELATFLVSQQQLDGEFVYFASKEPGGTPRDDVSSYYPGEAVFALASWAELDPDPRWLNTAVRGADWLIDIRDQGRGPEALDADHWLCYGLAALVRATHDPRYVDHALRIAEAIGVQRARVGGREPFHRDFLGGYYELPRSTPASTRAEALVGVLDACAAAGRACPQVPDQLRSALAHALQAQYTPDLLYWVRSPDRVMGHVAGGVLDPDLRNDYTQHALSALLGAERVLR
jgi:hypothetical protein